MNLSNIVNELSKDIELKTKVEKFKSSNHGSSTGDFVEIKMYWNPFKCEWTSIKENVIQDYILNKLKPYIKELCY